MVTLLRVAGVPVSCRPPPRPSSPCLEIWKEIPWVFFSLDSLLQDAGRPRVPPLPSPLGFPLWRSWASPLQPLAAGGPSSLGPPFLGSEGTPSPGFSLSALDTAPGCWGFPSPGIASLRCPLSGAPHHHSSALPKGPQSRGSIPLPVPGDRHESTLTMEAAGRPTPTAAPGTRHSPAHRRGSASQQPPGPPQKNPTSRGSSGIPPRGISGSALESRKIQRSSSQKNSTRNPP